MSLSDYQREIDEITNRVNTIDIHSLSSVKVEAEIPGYFIIIFVIVFALVIFLLTKLEWKTNPK